MRAKMKVNHWGRARQFAIAQPQARSALYAWKRAVIAADWKSFAEIKSTFNTADWYKGAIIFDIAGNNYRLIAICRFELGRVYIDKILTHREYEKGTWRQRYDRRNT